MVTHDPGAAAHSDLVLFLADGRIVDEMARPTAEAVLERMRLFSGGGQPQATSPGSPADGDAEAPSLTKPTDED
jgi:putative ABC transport system ATP-binding protein